MSIYAIRGRLIDGVADSALEDGLVLTDGNKITYAGKYEPALVPEKAEVISAGEGTILPGFIDAHAHICGTVAKAGIINDDKLLGAAHEVGVLLDCGFTGLRDMTLGSPALARATEGGYLRGPRIFPGGRVLSCTSGHVDLDINMTKEEYNRTAWLGELCDGEAECLEAARRQFRRGARFIKVCTTGGVSSLTDKLTDVQFAPNELRVIVEEAQRHGTYVAAHCSSNAGTLHALNNGVTSIEHGVDLPESTLELMLKKDATLVTTIWISTNVAKMPGMHPAMEAKAKMCAETHIRTLRDAAKMGVRIAFGTDFSNSGFTPYDKIGREFEAMVEVGMTNMQAIRAATINAAHLTMNADAVGSIEAGKLADIVIAAGDPLKDISCLTGSENIKLVMKDGKVEKNIL